MTAVVDVFGGRSALPWQWRYLLASPAWIKACFGSYGSAKTTAAALCFLKGCVQNPYRPSYGQDRPFSFVVGLTWRVLEESSIRVLRRVFPKEIIRKEYKVDRRWLLANGHEILFRSAEGELEGGTSCQLWLDEAHKLDYPFWENAQARVRDPLAEGTKQILVSARPIRGWLDDAFERPEHLADPSRYVIHVGTKDNPALYDTPEGREVLRQLRAGTSLRRAKSLEDGSWEVDTLAAFFEFEGPRHIVSQPARKDRPTHVAMDVGEKCAVLFGQKGRRRLRDSLGRTYEDDTVHIVDELHPENVSTETAMRQAKARGWNIVSDETTISVDPRTSIDQREAIHRVLGDRVQIVQRRRGQYGYEITDGVDSVNAALRDADGNVRLTFDASLPRHDESLLYQLPKAKKRRDGTRYVKDQREHVVDALRYLVLELLPLRERTFGPSGS